ncbi:uncharacterized protein BO97DRAFT_229627 [Aspergillus homomorphus CBS 101889]|uniref:Uncharacterized protein n=1 Tax=Aspergillus homomorphus (strain CBS 101889) TaxID=1450537 RepID=A0A395HL72_ASPHC|nr:hypothetical protein BO97DRAFT_229627 [Aspergillus homomorphus CBS 101889]RAL07975.1 hypothetical protein BO97DRAFT_229627 [Aspergillus homomorphus CBS 101889]
MVGLLTRGLWDWPVGFWSRYSLFVLCCILVSLFCFCVGTASVDSGLFARRDTAFITASGVWVSGVYVSGASRFPLIFGGFQVFYFLFGSGSGREFGRSILSPFLRVLFNGGLSFITGQTSSKELLESVDLQRVLDCLYVMFFLR